MVTLRATSVLYDYLPDITFPSFRIIFTTERVHVHNLHIIKTKLYDTAEIIILIVIIVIRPLQIASRPMGCGKHHWIYRDLQKLTLYGRIHRLVRMSVLALALGGPATEAKLRKDRWPAQATLWSKLHYSANEPRPRGSGLI